MTLSDIARAAARRSEAKRVAEMMVQDDAARGAKTRRGKRGERQRARLFADELLPASERTQQRRLLLFSSSFPASVLTPPQSYF